MGPEFAGQGKVLSLPQNCHKRDNLERNRSTQSPQNRAWLAAFRNAKHSIKVLTPNMDSEHFIQEIKNAVKRGVTVQLVTGKEFNERVQSILGYNRTNTWVINHFHSEFAKLREEAIKLEAPFNFKSKWYSAPDYDGDGRTPNTVGNGPGASHAKLLIVDDEVVITGSGNQTLYSWYHSCEYNVAIEDEFAVNQAVDFFQGVWNRSISTHFH